MTGIHLIELLDARDRRAARQKELLELYGVPLVGLTVVSPGPVKDGPASLRAAELAEEALRAALHDAGVKILFAETTREKTGPWGLFAVDAAERPMKRLLLEIEESHIAGRLFDLDLIGLDGRPLQRAAFGLPPRACLLCGGVAGDCARSRAHSLPDLTRRIEGILAAAEGRFRPIIMETSPRGV